MALAARSMSVTIVHRTSSVEEFESIVESVGFRAHDHPAVQTASANTVFCVCAEEEGRTVGVGRVVGDGAISFFLTNVMVRPSHQRRGIGTLIVKALCSSIERLPYRNIVLEAVPQPGSTSFMSAWALERRGMRPQGW